MSTGGAGGWARRREIVGLVAVVLVGATLFVAFAERERGHELEEWRARLGAMADDRALSIDQWLDTRLAYARVLAREEPVLGRLAQDFVPGDSIPELPFLTREREAHGFPRTWLVDRQGRIRAGAAGTRPPTAVEIRHGLEAVAVGRAGVQLVRTDGDEVSLSFAAPAPNGTGAVLLRVDPEDFLFPLLRMEPVVTGTGETLLGELQGDSVVFLGPLRKQSGLPTTFRRPAGMDGLAMTAALEGRETFGEFRDYTGVPVLAVTRRLESAPWGLVTKVDRDEALAEHRRELVLLAGFFGGFLLAALGLAWSYWMRRRDRETRRAAEALRRSEEKFRLLFEQSRDAIFLTAPDGRILDANRACREMFGLEGRNLSRHNARDFYTDPVDREIFRHRMEHEGEVGNFEVELQDTAGRRFVGLFSAAARYGEDGEPVSFQGSVRDITERKEAERRLRASEERLRLTQENAPIGIAHVALDGTFVEVNPALCEMMGYPREELVGMTFHDITHPDDVGDDLAHAERLLADEIRWYEMEKRYIHADGSLVWIHLTGSLVRDANGEPLHFVAHIHDISERVEARKKLEESHRRSRAVLDTITDAVVLVDRSGTLNYANPAAERILGVTPSDAAGRTFDDPRWKITDVDGGPFPVEELPFMRVMRDESPVHDVRHAVERPSGERTIVSVNAAPLRDGEGEVQGMVASVQDVTEQVRAEREVRRLNRELERRVRERTAELSAANQELEAFAYSVSHDLRAPLRALDGFSQALAEDYGDRLDGEALDFLQRIRANSQRMARLIDDILKLSRVSRRELGRVPVDLAELAREVWRELGEMDDTEIDFGCPDTLPATGDPHLLRVMLENLLGNARKFSRDEPSPRVQVGTGEVEGEPAFFVRDNGVGFDMAYADKLFKAFHRLHKEAEFEGTGIGLATVQRIVRRHGGWVRAEGEPGEGATFWFSLEGTPLTAPARSGRPPPGPGR